MKPLKTFIKGFQQGIKQFGEHMNTSIVSILLVGVYIIGVGFSSISAKLFGKKFLELKAKESKEKTYWSDLNLKKKKREEYHRQF